jgi:hypothetical protein
MAKNFNISDRKQRFYQPHFIPMGLVVVFLLLAVGLSHSAVISGTSTIMPSATESEIVAGGETIIIDLTGDEWVDPFNDTIRRAIIDGITSAMSETTGWNAEVRDKQLVGGVARSTDTQVTVTLDAQAAYDITATEVITVTIPASALVTSSQAVVAAPVFVVTLGTPPTVKDYQVQNSELDGDPDPTCADKVNPYPTAPTVEMIVDPGTTCGDEDKVKWKVATTTPQTMLITYFKNGGSGYAADTLVEVQNTGNSITFKSKLVTGDYAVELWEVDPVDGSFDTLKATDSKALDTINANVTWTDFSGLTGTISENMTFGFKFIFTADNSTASDCELKFGEYGVDRVQQKFSIAETPVVGPIAAVSGRGSL